MIGKEKYKEINANLNKKLAEKRFFIAQHRGGAGGNCVENTILAFKTSLMLGADMFELDVSKSTDGKLYCYHDTTEELNLRLHRNIEEFSSSAIDEFKQYNSIWEPSGCHVQSLEGVFQEFTDGELYNVDRSWNKLEETFALMNQYPHCVQQALLKAPAKKEILDKYEKEPTKFMFMAIVKTLEDIELVLSYENINVVGFELIAKSEEDDMWQDSLIEELHDKGYFVWFNAITLSCLDRHILCAGYDDERSLKEGFDKGWGVLIHKNVDIIQTDWPSLLSNYRDSLESNMDNE